MSTKIELLPPATALINGIRAIGYSFSTAVADIIDNSISAHASKIDIYSDPYDNPYFEILDNGVGMSKSELTNAMTFGSNRDGKDNLIDDLGRFGLGLKSASLSQCRHFIVISKKNDLISAMEYNLDEIQKTSKWELNELEISEIEHEPGFYNLMKYQSGTLVIWKNFDKLESDTAYFEDSFREAVSESKKHIELVFHRFYNKLDIYYNDKRIERRDPFLLSSSKIQTGRTTILPIEDTSITIIPHILPPANSLTIEEKSLLGNPKSLHDDQGFYIYRNERLIIWGSWLHMGYKSELNKLARIQIDIPTTLDNMWHLDVKKSSAKIPDSIKDKIRAAIDDSMFRSKKTTRYQGNKELTEQEPVWNRIILRDGFVRYEINRNNPVYQVLTNMIGQKENEFLNEFLSQIECFIP